MITLECSYSKKVGLPQYSSHLFSIMLRTEIDDLGAVQAESAHPYAPLQQSVDASIQPVGFLPQSTGNGNGAAGTGADHRDDRACSPKRRDLIRAGQLMRFEVIDHIILGHA